MINRSASPNQTTYLPNPRQNSKKTSNPLSVVTTLQRLSSVLEIAKSVQTPSHGPDKTVINATACLAWSGGWTAVFHMYTTDESTNCMCQYINTHSSHQTYGQLIAHVHTPAQGSSATDKTTRLLSSANFLLLRL